MKFLAIFQASPTIFQAFPMISLPFLKESVAPFLMFPAFLKESVAPFLMFRVCLT